MKKLNYVIGLLATLLLAFVCEVTCHAEEYFVENGIRYMLSVSKSDHSKYCTVIENREAPYSGVVEIPAFAGGYPVTKISGAFFDCVDLKEVYIHAPMKELGNCDFFGCEALEKVVLPETLTFLGTSTFYGCNSLKEIDLPERINGIPTEAFGCCNSLVNVVIPENALFIGMRAFEGCTFKNINVPDRVEYIRHGAFSGSALETIHIGKGLVQIGAGVFKYCDNLKSVYITTPEPPEFVSNYGFADEDDLSNVILYVPEASMGKYRASEYWSLYKEIRSIESSGIADTEIDSEETEVIYDTQGRRLKHKLPGINIVNGKKIIVPSTR